MNASISQPVSRVGTIRRRDFIFIPVKVAKPSLKFISSIRIPSLNELLNCSKPNISERVQHFLPQKPSIHTGGTLHTPIRSLSMFTMFRRFNYNQINYYFMERTANCGFFGCGRQEGGHQETAQEQLSSNYALQRTTKIAKPNEKIMPLSPQHKQIFSFRLNCFRNTQHSDKPILPARHATANLQETQPKLIQFRSCQKVVSVAPIQPSQNLQAQRVFRSPPPHFETRLLREQRSPQAMRSMMLPSPPQQQSVRITFHAPSEAQQSQVDGNSKNSQYTHYSSKKSDVHLPQTPKAFSNENELDFGDKWTIQTDKCSTQKSCIFGDGGETQRTLIDYLNEDQPLKSDDGQAKNKKYEFTSHPYTNPNKNTNYSPMVEQRVPMLRSHHHTAIVRTMPQPLPYRINA